MITLDARLSDTTQEFVDSDHKITWGSSSVEVFASPHLRMDRRIGLNSREIWVGEEIDPFGTLDRNRDVLLPTREITSQDGVRICLSSSPNGTCQIARTLGGMTPLYIATSGERIVASWKFEVAVGALSDVRPDVEACRRLLEHGQSRTRNQIIEGISMLWPGEAVTFDRNGLFFDEIRSPSAIVSSALTDDARVTDEFIALIADSVSSATRRSKAVLVELSGGFDSSCVAVAARTIRTDLSSYGVIQPGIAGRQQRNRRSELVKLLQLSDHEGSAADYTPIRSLEVPEFRVTPFDDLYRMPCVAAVDSHPTPGIDLVLTGIGGDELTKENTFGKYDWELAGIQSTSAIIAAVSRADMFMRRGIWPKNPLVSPSVVNFCRALPPSIRRNRQLNTLTLARSGLSDGFLFPRYFENFGTVLSIDGIETDYDALFEYSIVADFGIADITVILAQARNETLLGLPLKLLGELYRLAKLERVLRAYIE